jgi:hypothetical protein
MSKRKVLEDTLLVNGIFEISVKYHKEETPSDIVEFHGYHELGNNIEIEIISVLVTINKKPVDIYPLLTQPQIDKISEELAYL